MLLLSEVLFLRRCNDTGNTGTRERGEARAVRPQMATAFTFDVRGQRGTIPSIGLGTATLNGDVLVAAIRTAIRQGYRHFDTALLYDNQAAVGRGIAEAIAAGDVTRAELFITTKVAF